MNNNDKKMIALWAVDYAQKNGAKEAAVSIYNYIGSDIEVRNQKIETIQESIESGLNIKLYVDNKYSSHSTNRIKKEDLKKFIKEAIAATKYLGEDKYRCLPNEDLYFKKSSLDLKLVDDNYKKVDPAEKIKIAKAIEAETKGYHKAINSVTGNFGDGYVHSIYVTSNGFMGERESTNFSISASASLKSGDARPSDAEWFSSHFYKDINPQGIGKRAVDRALRKLNQTKIKSGKYNMLVENRVASRLLGALLQGVDGYNLQQKRSFFEGKLNKKVGSNKLNLISDPHIISGAGSRLFDSEGLKLEKLPIFENGVLKNYFINTYIGKKLDMKPTTGSATNLILQPGTKNLNELIKTMHNGIYVIGFNGGNSNSLTGDFSYGVEGFLVKNGKLAQPVSGMNITGNLLDVWNRLAEVGNDPIMFSSRRIPSYIIEGIDFSGL